MLTTTQIPSSPASANAATSVDTLSSAQIAEAPAPRPRARSMLIDSPLGSTATKSTYASKVPALIDQVSAHSDHPPEVNSRSISARPPSPRTSRSPNCNGSAAGPSTHSKPTGAILGRSSTSPASARRVVPKRRALPAVARLAVRTANLQISGSVSSSARDRKRQGCISVGTRPVPSPARSWRRISRIPASTARVSSSTLVPNDASWKSNEKGNVHNSRVSLMFRATWSDIGESNLLIAGEVISSAPMLRGETRQPTIHTASPIA
mmetsp:Transcript_115682/g.327110  ORF Transcript_115682/g.327110 Transcript_115682/m.327110 type:complete len:265 (-) Transcript_115682:163-957(-)